MWVFDFGLDSPPQGLLQSLSGQVAVQDGVVVQVLDEEHVVAPVLEVLGQYLLAQAVGDGLVGLRLDAN